MMSNTKISPFSRGLPSIYTTYIWKKTRNYILPLITASLAKKEAKKVSQRHGNTAFTAYPSSVLLERTEKYVSTRQVFANVREHLSLGNFGWPK